MPASSRLLSITGSNELRLPQRDPPGACACGPRAKGNPGLAAGEFFAVRKPKALVLGLLLQHFLEFFVADLGQVGGVGLHVLVFDGA